MTERVLVIEDDASIAEGLRINLESEGYEVLGAEDGEAGLAMVREKAAPRALERWSRSVSTSMTKDDDICFQHFQAWKVHALCD